VQVYSYVLAFEVLDNLPHDCVVKKEGSTDWMEVVVEKEPSGGLQLSERPLQDPLIQKVLTSAWWDKPGLSTTQCHAMLSVVGSDGRSMWTRHVLDDLKLS
jgi:hypothetical protein